MIRPRLWTGWFRENRIMFLKVSGGLIDYPILYINQEKSIMSRKNPLRKTNPFSCISHHYLSANPQQTNSAFIDGTGNDSIKSSLVKVRSVYLCFLLIECSLYVFENLYYLNG